MRPIDIPAIEEQARNLRAAEIHRINGLFAERAELLARSMGSKSLGAGNLTGILSPKASQKGLQIFL